MRQRGVLPVILACLILIALTLTFRNTIATISSWRTAVLHPKERLTIDTEQVAKAYQTFRNQINPAHLNISARLAMFDALCSVSLGSGSCRRIPTECRRSNGYGTLPYEVWSNATTVVSDCSRKITGSLPVTIQQLPLLLALAHTFKLQTPKDSELWDVIWIVAPQEEVQLIFDAVREAQLLHDTFRFISQDIVFRERPDVDGYRGWHLQQDLKLALGWAARTNLILNLDADIMFAKPLVYEDLFDHRHRAYTVSSVAKRHWSWQHRNLQNTCKSAKIDCKGINADSTVIGFTPIPFYVPLLFSMAQHFTVREGKPWLEHLVGLRLGEPSRVWTEYSLYWIYARSIGAYDEHHKPLPKERFCSRIHHHGPEQLASAYKLHPAERVPFLDVSDHEISNLEAWSTAIRSTQDPWV